MAEDFVPFQKIPRLRRGCVITEKIDGTNASIWIDESGEGPAFRVASRKRFITPDDDNFGFARWAYDRQAELTEALGSGTHFGEWWGPGIQRGYGLANKRFSLFNTGRWSGQDEVGPCSVVPILYEGPFTDEAVTNALASLSETGSIASPGFMRPEGIVVFHAASRALYKVTLENDEEPKGLREKEAVHG